VLKKADCFSFFQPTPKSKEQFDPQAKMFPYSKSLGVLGGTQFRYFSV